MSDTVRHATRPLLALAAAALLAASACGLGREAATGSAVPDPGSAEARWPYAGVLADGSAFRLAGRIADKARAHGEIGFVSSYGSAVVPLAGDQFRAGYAAGLADAGRRYPMHGTLIGGDLSPGDKIGQVAGIDALLETGAIDCLSIEPAAAEGFATVANRVLAAGIPVFTVGLPAGGNELAALVVDPEAEAALAAAALVDWAKAADLRLRRFALSAADPETSQAQARLTAFRRAVQDAIPKASFLTTEEDAIVTTWDARQARAAYAAFLAQHPDVQLILSADVGAGAANRAIRDAGLEGKAFTAGWSLGADQLDAIEAGVQVLAIDQGWAAQGAFGPTACASLFADGAIAEASPEPTVVTKAGVAAARERLEAIGP